MQIRLLMNDIVRQTTLLIAQLSTAAGVREPLSHVTDQVFLELSRELDARGIRLKVAADMFGMTLRSYQLKLRRLAEQSDRRGACLWLSSFLSSPDPSTCNGVRRWPRQVACDAPVVTRELCGDRASGLGDTLIDASDWLEHLDMGGVQ